ncbi:MAG: glycine cleavage system protein GcvH [Synergistetes bacterium]|nr:glycine cleavage system protein GcvH [Synergistota bacterium]MCX8127455.1 glycine cleavage system protein GcvH [Synergistota bacterium]MDW8192768.1 glycine cleavage system protein GcvH [Synergistota bacterium]
MIPKELKYTKEHEWIRIENGVGTVGITHYAQEQLGDIVFVELPSTGRDVGKMETVAVVESVKAASDIYTPVSGKIIEVNEELNSSPNLINEDPYGKGWIFKIKLSDPREIKELLSAEEYEKLITEG